jgi:hypothetical protein
MNRLKSLGNIELQKLLTEKETGPKTEVTSVYRSSSDRFSFMLYEEQI